MNRYGFIFSKIGIGINEIAVPMKTVLIEIIIGVTLFFDKVDIKKHKQEIVIITVLEIKKDKK